MNGLIIDTNAYSSLRRSGELKSVFEHAPVLAMNSIVLGELHFGFALGNRPDQNRRELFEFINDCAIRILDIDATMAEHYSVLMKSLRLVGTPLPTNDVWIAASAIQHQFDIITFDLHFRSIAGLRSDTTLLDFQS